MLNLGKSINIMHLVNRIKDKKHIIMPIVVEKAVDKIQHCFRILKNSQQTRNRI